MQCLCSTSSYFGRVENVRRNPESYYDQRYYSHVVYEYVTSDGLRHMAKLRLLPASGEEETGLPNEDDQKHPWSVIKIYIFPLAIHPLVNIQNLGIGKNRA